MVQGFSVATSRRNENPCESMSEKGLPTPLFFFMVNLYENKKASS
jgi:hypothetical protein